MATTILLLLIGVWLLVQTLIGDLPRRLLSWRVAPKEAVDGN